MAAYGALNGALTNATTAVVLAADPGHDPVDHLVMIDDEILTVSSRSTVTLTSVRAAEHTVAVAHTSTTTVYEVIKVDHSDVGMTVYYYDSAGAEVTRRIGVAAASPTSQALLNQVSPVGTVVSGSLATTTFVSGTGKQISTTRDVDLYVPVTYNASAADATLTVALSPDNSTYSTLGVETVKFATNPENGGIRILRVRVPAGWYVKLTAVNATIGTGTYA